MQSRKTLYETLKNEKKINVDSKNTDDEPSIITTQMCCNATGKKPKQISALAFIYPDNLLL